MNKHLGSCLCGEVRFEVTGDFERFFLCHCGRCRKDTGSAHAANLAVYEASPARLRERTSVPSVASRLSYTTNRRSPGPQHEVGPQDSYDQARRVWSGRTSSVRRPYSSCPHVVASPLGSTVRTGVPKSY